MFIQRVPDFLGYNFVLLRIAPSVLDCMCVLILFFSKNVYTCTCGTNYYLAIPNRDFRRHPTQPWYSQLSPQYPSSSLPTSQFHRIFLDSICLPSLRPRSFRDSSCSVPYIPSKKMCP